MMTNEEIKQAREIQKSIANRAIKRISTLSKMAHEEVPQVLIASELRLTLQVLSEMASTMDPKFLETGGTKKYLTEEAMKYGKEQVNSTYLSEDPEWRESAKKWGTHQLADAHELVNTLIREYYIPKPEKDVH